MKKNNFNNKYLNAKTKLFILKKNLSKKLLRIKKKLKINIKRKKIFY